MEGVRNSRMVLCIVTGPYKDPDNSDPKEQNAYFSRPFCQEELREAKEYGIQIQPIVHMDDRTEISAFRAAAGEEFYFVFDNQCIYAVPFEKDLWEFTVGKIKKALNNVMVESPPAGDMVSPGAVVERKVPSKQKQIPSAGRVAERDAAEAPEEGAAEVPPAAPYEMDSRAAAEEQNPAVRVEQATQKPPHPHSGPGRLRTGEALWATKKPEPKGKEAKEQEGEMTSNMKDAIALKDQYKKGKITAKEFERNIQDQHMKGILTGKEYNQLKLG